MGIAIASRDGMNRQSLFAIVPLAAALGACADAPPERDVIPPPAQAPAPARLTTPNVTEPPAPAPTARGTYASMTPPSTQHTPPRPKTRGGATRSDSLPAVPAAPPAP
jgi:hypothetical protein